LILTWLAVAVAADGQEGVYSARLSAAEDSSTGRLTLDPPLPLSLDTTPRPAPKLMVASWDDHPDRWHLRSNTSLWFTAMDGTVGRGDFETDVDVGFDDLFDKMNLGFVLDLQAGKGPWTVLFYGMWSEFEADAQTVRGFDADAESTFALIDLGFAYEFVRIPLGAGGEGQGGQSEFGLEGVAGIRWTYLSAEIDINEGPFAGFNEDREKNWFDPYVGLRGRLDFSHECNVSVLGTVGGFGVGSDFAWSLYAEFEYRFNPTWSAFVGYRVFDYDYEDDGFKFDMMLHGPVIGIGWRM
jgi:hypothetical protein